MKILIKKIPKAKSGLTASKAREILHDGTAHGKPITDKQRRYFGYVSGGGKADSGLEIEGDKFTPLSKDTIMINGDSHEDGGTKVNYFGRKVEAEKGEPLSISKDGSAVIYGNMVNPLTGNKFKKDAEQLAGKEKKIEGMMDRATNLINENDPYDKWENLSFNSGKVMLEGGMRKRQELKDSKEWLSSIQKAMLDKAAELGADPQDFSKGKLTKAKNGAYAQAGYNLPNESLLNDPNINPQFKKAFTQMMTDAPDFVKQGLSVGSGFRSSNAQKALYDEGVRKYGKNVGKYVATPGGSAHEYGLAADLKFMSPEAKKWVYENAKDYGISFPLPDTDPNHAIYSDIMEGGTWRGRGTRLRTYGKDIATNPLDVSYQSLNNLGKVGPRSLNAKYGPEDITTYLGKYTPTLPPVTLQDQPQTPVTGKKPEPYGFTYTPPRDYQKPSNAGPFDTTQILPELYTLASNKQEPVWLQQYHPQLFQPYKVSFQDRLNENQAAFNAVQRSQVHNPSAQAALAAQKYNADNNTLAEEFRTNQGIEQDVVNKNISLLNDAQLKNLSLADNQYVRQATTKSKVKEQNQVVLDSISSKLQQHALENKTLKVYENMYPNFYFDKNYRTKYYGPSAGELINFDDNTSSGGVGDNKTVTSYDKNNTVKSTRVTADKPTKQQIDFQTLQQKKFNYMKGIMKLNPQESLAQKMKKNPYFNTFGAIKQ